MRASGVAVSALSAQRVLGANDRVRVGLVGCGGRGRYVAGLMRQAPHTEFVAAADVYLPNAEIAQKWAGPEAKAVQDFRKLLAMKDVDAVLIATPDHWHSQIAILAAAAGKDVYVEKPTSLTIREGRAMVNAARKYNRVMQVGTQHRSATHFKKIAAMRLAGELGEVHYIRVWNYVNATPDGLGAKPDSEPPAGLDWDFYLGPAPKVPFNRNRFLGTYRYFFDYSGGYITDFGNHRLDSAIEIMGENAPLSIAAAGGRFMLKDGGDVPDILQVTYEFPGFIMTYESSNINGFGMGNRTPGHKYYNAQGEYDQPNGIALYGSRGTVFCERIGWETFPEAKTLRRPMGVGWLAREMTNVSDATKEHAANFIDCVRTRATPNADIEIGHRSTSIALLGNIAYKVGRKLKWDAKKEEFIGDAEANKLLHREPRKPWNLA